MSFRPMHRPGQGFKLFRILSRVGGVTSGGRAHTNSLAPQGEFYGMLTKASPEEIEKYKKTDHPITHTILQKGSKNRAKATDVLELVVAGEKKGRRFRVQVEPQDPGELGHFLIYNVEERADL